MAVALDRFPGRGYGSRPPVIAPLKGRSLALAVVLAALGACAPPERDAAPLDRLTFPTGLAFHEGRLVAVSSNFDLTYDADDGGSVMTIAADASLGAAAQVDGAVRIPSYGGQVAVAAPAPCGLPAAQVVSVSRKSRNAYVLALDGAGALSCGAGCELPLGAGGGMDPYGVTVACTPGRPARAFVGFLRSSDGLPRLAEITLGDVPSARTGVISNASGTTGTLAYDPDADRLFFTGLGSGTSLAWIDLAGGCRIGDDDAACVVQQATLAATVRGAALRALALGALRPGVPRRLYAAATMYDADLEASAGFRLEIGSALLVLELEENAFGSVTPRFLGSIDMYFGAGEVRVLPAQPGRGDVVAVAAGEAGEIWLYDDDVGQFVAKVGRDPLTGAPLLGRLPYAMALETRADAVRIYVASFEEGFVSAVDVDPENPGAPVIVPARIAEVGR